MYEARVRESILHWLLNKILNVSLSKLCDLRLTVRNAVLETDKRLCCCVGGEVLPMLSKWKCIFEAMLVEQYMNDLYAMCLKVIPVFST